jgi:carboxylesterase
MKHPETRRIIPGAKNAILFLHGIAGTPNQFRLLIPLEELVPADWTVFNLRYPGYGGDVRNFGKSNIHQWRSYARAAFLELSESHEKVVIVGHSMGTLFAMQLALEFPERVSGLFLLNVPLRPMPRLFFVPNCLRLAFGCIRPDHPLEACFEKACGVTPTPLVWRYIRWIPRILELFGEIIRTEKGMGNLTVPCIAWQSRKDDLVSNFTAPVLRKSGVMEVHELPDSTHFYYAPRDKATVCEAFEYEIKKISG